MKPFRLSITLIFSTLLVGCQKSPDSTIETFYRQLESGDTRAAEKYVGRKVADLFGSERIILALDKAAKKINDCGGIKSIAVQLEKENDSAEGRVTVTYAGECPERRERVALERQNGTWGIMISWTFIDYLLKE